jgi:hypothetical protein
VRKLHLNRKLPDIGKRAHNLFQFKDRGMNQDSLPVSILCLEDGFSLILVAVAGFIRTPNQMWC